MIDDDKQIVDTIKSSLNLDFEEPCLDTKIQEIKSVLLENGILESNLKDNIISSIILSAERVANKVCNNVKNLKFLRDFKIDKILTSKKFGIPIMICFLGLIFWLTITGANYPSKMLSGLFSYIEIELVKFFNFINSPDWLTSVIIDGAFKTLAWIVSVMLPPMAIFFPLFTILEDLGYLPRIAFNLDKYFKKAGCSGKQSLTMCMGFGCNAAGVTGARIIDSPREKLLSILTNSFVPCNGKFPFLICMASILIGSFFTNGVTSILSSLIVLALIIFGIFMTLIISKLLSKTIVKGAPSSFILELPPYRKPQIGKILVRSIFDRTLFVLGRAIVVAIPAGIVIWLFSNISINGISILSYIANFLNPFAKLLGFDGYILTAFILGIPANEIVLPILLMGYINAGTLVNLEDYSTIGTILFQNGWTLITFINVMIFSLLHFPCATTLLTIKKETNSWKWTFLSFALPTICGILICMITNLIYSLCPSF